MNDNSAYFTEVVVGNVIQELPKSFLPASAALENGHYPFICSSSSLKYTDCWLRNKPAVVMGTGGVASVHLGKEEFSYSTDTWGFWSVENLVSTEFLFRKIQQYLPLIDYAGFEGSGLKHLRKDYVQKLVFDVPCDARIANKIIEILDTIDQAIEKTEALIEKYQQIKAGLMHDLFTRGIAADGKLRPPREQAPELYQETPIGWIPKEWSYLPASDLCHPITKGTTPSSFDNANQKGAIPYLRVEHLSFDGSVKLNERILFVSKQIHNSELLRSKVFPGDILMNIVGPPLGKLSLIPELYPEWNTNQAVAIYRLLNKKNTKYLLFYLLSEFSQRWFFVRSKQTSGQVNLTLEMCANIEIPMSNSEGEIAEITDKLSQIYEKIEIENNFLKKLKIQKKGLMHDLLTGKVPVGINDAVTND